MEGRSAVFRIVPEPDDHTGTGWTATINHHDTTAGREGSEPEVALKRGREGLPTVYRLYEPYPNPFNPETTLKVDLPEPGRVALIVYDLVGRKVDEVMGSTMEAGSHLIRWKGNGAASGVYYARLTVTSEAGRMAYMRVVKLLLLR
jgi:hypothetical protein